MVVPGTIRVFVVDDHQVVRMGLKTMLESASDISRCWGRRLRPGSNRPYRRRGGGCFTYRPSEWLE